MAAGGHPEQMKMQVGRRPGGPTRFACGGRGARIADTPFSYQAKKKASRNDGDSLT